MNSWQRLGNLSPKDLVAPRLEMHHAVQLVSIAVARALVPHRDDDSHTALEWINADGQWVCEEIPETYGLRAGFRPSDFVLTLGAEKLELAGKTLADGLAWLRERLDRDADKVELDVHYEMPPHPVADAGAAFNPELAAGFRELAGYFGNAARLLGAVVEANAGATSIRTWPHHFDIALLVPAGPEGDAFSRTVGVGLSPGDEAYAEPYFYVNAYPRPEAPELVELPRGHWRTEGFFAAVLTASEWLEGGDAGQEGRGREFLEAAIAAARGLLG